METRSGDEGGGSRGLVGGRRSRRTTTHRLLATALGILAALVLLEAILRLLALVAPHLLDRSGFQPRDGDTFRILCIGDSNTYGTGVDREQSYPARLEALLNASLERGRVQVVNLGVPGSNSGQALRRLPEYIESYAPDLLIMLTGVNDYWNSADMDVAGDPVRPKALQRLLMASRLCRLVYLAATDLFSRRRSMPEDEPEMAGGWCLVEDGEVVGVRSEDSEGLLEAWAAGESTIPCHEVRHGANTFQFQNLRRALDLKPKAHRRVFAANLLQIERVAAAAGVPLVLPTYPASRGWYYRVANSVIEQSSGALVVSQRAFEDLAPYLPETYEPSDLFFPDRHPKAPLYDAFARNLCEALVRERLVPAPGCG